MGRFNFLALHVLGSYCVVFDYLLV